MHCRKDFLDLTPLERNRLANALNELWDQNRFLIYGPLHEDGWFSIHRGPAGRDLPLSSCQGRVGTWWET